MKRHIVILCILLINTGLFSKNLNQNYLAPMHNPNNVFKEAYLDNSFFQQELENFLRVLPTDIKDLTIKGKIRNRTISIIDFLTKKEFPKGGYALGRREENLTLDWLAMFSGLTCWDLAYQEIFGRLVERTNNFLNAITGVSAITGGEIIFFVPPNIFSRIGFTEKEIEWFISNSEHLDKVTFVLGAYDFFNKDYFIKDLPDKTLRGISDYISRKFRLPNRSFKPGNVNRLKQQALHFLIRKIFPKNDSIFFKPFHFINRIISKYIKRNLTKTCS